jgi:hypothetical protein
LADRENPNSGQEIRGAGVAGDRDVDVVPGGDAIGDAMRGVD